MANSKFEKTPVEEQAKFTESFDPERGNSRERRKQTRKVNNEMKKQSSLYNDKGIHIATKKDLCDCLHEECPGCFFPCPRCKSCKCGHECRAGRKWMYDSYEVEGLEIKKINKVKN